MPQLFGSRALVRLGRRTRMRIARGDSGVTSGREGDQLAGVSVVSVKSTFDQAMGLKLVNDSVA